MPFISNGSSLLSEIDGLDLLGALKQTVGSDKREGYFRDDTLAGNRLIGRGFLLGHSTRFSSIEIRQPYLLIDAVMELLDPPQNQQLYPSYPATQPPHTQMQYERT